jgi:hypothetical protein
MHITGRLKAGIVEPEENSIARQRLGKHVSSTTPNNGNIVGNGVFCWVLPEAI